MSSSSLKLLIFRLRVMEEPQSFRLSSSEFPTSVKDTMRDVYRCGQLISIFTIFEEDNCLLLDKNAYECLQLTGIYLNMVSKELNYSQPTNISINGFHVLMICFPRSGMYVDVTLVSEDLREVPAHKIVLSSGSKVENILNPVKIFAI